MQTRFLLGKQLACLILVLIMTIGSFAVSPGAMANQMDIIKVGLITDAPTLEEGSFNALAYAGLQRAETDFGVDGTIYFSADADDIETNLAQCVADGNMLCTMVGFLGADQTFAAAQANPTTLFAILDVSYEDDLSNLQGTIFASEQAAYLAGTLAGHMTESDIIGLIGGMDIPPVTVFLDGFANGAICANPGVSTILEITDDFGNPALGSFVAQDMLDQGADVIFPAAGPTGTGALLTASQAGAWVVGVDSDQYLSVFGNGTVPGSEYMLTSVMKRLDNAIYQIISSVVDDAFVSGNVVYDLSVEGVALAPYHEADPLIPADVKAAVESARLGILAGTIDPFELCPSHFLYLPYSSKDIQP
jgi:basic membrane protein A